MNPFMMSNPMFLQQLLGTSGMYSQAAQNTINSIDRRWATPMMDANLRQLNKNEGTNDFMRNILQSAAQNIFSGQFNPRQAMMGGNNYSPRSVNRGPSFRRV